MRESLMGTAFPNIREQFKKAAEQQPPWQALFDALGKRPVEDPTRRVRIVNVKTDPVVVPGQSPGPEITQTTADVLPHVRVRTVETVRKDDLGGLSAWEATASRKVAAWAELALKTANRVLFFKLQPELEEKGHDSCALDGLPGAIEQARGILQGYAMTLLVSAARHADLIAEDDLSKEVVQALKGGTVAPVAELSDSNAYILRHGAGDVVVEIVHELQPHWDYGNVGSVELIALQEFVVVAEKKVPAYKLTLL